MLVLWTVTAAPTGPSVPWIYLFGALCAGGLLDLLWRIYRRTNSGKLDDAIQIAKAAQEVADGSRELFARNKIELEAAQQQIANYLDHLVEVNRQLGAALSRISRLEEKLRVTDGLNRELHQQLAEATSQRDALVLEARELRDRLKALGTT